TKSNPASSASRACRTISEGGKVSAISLNPTSTIVVRPSSVLSVLHRGSPGPGADKPVGARQARARRRTPAAADVTTAAAPRALSTYSGQGPASVAGVSSVRSGIEAMSAAGTNTSVCRVTSTSGAMIDLIQQVEETIVAQMCSSARSLVVA